MKDHYRRELKKSMNDPTAPTSQWPYYKKMRFMKSQMFVSLRRKNDGEEHMEILSSEGEEMDNSQWNNNIPRKRELNETLEDYELTQDYGQLMKFENQVHQLAQEREQQEMEQDPDETQDHSQAQDDQEEEDHTHLSPMVSIQEQQSQMDGHQTQLHQTQLHQSQNQMHQTQLHQSQLQDQTVLPNNITSISNSTMNELVGIPTIVTTTASSLSDRLSAMQQQQQNSMQHQNHEMNGQLAEIAVRQSAIQHQQGQINGRLSGMHRDAELSAIQERANIEAYHRRAEMTAMQQRAQMDVMRQRVDNSETGENGVGSSNMVSPIVGDERGGISDDYHFFMSLMPHVRHFSSLQKLKVRSRIQQVIIEEASNCQSYDPLANC